MELGKSDEAAIPAWFTIENGVVKAVEPPEERGEASSRATPKPAAPPLEEVKASAIAYYSDLAFQLRRAVIPDYKMQNAALGVYDESETTAIRNTVKAFRDEFYRLKSVIEKARSIKALKDVTPNFPGDPVLAEPTPSVDSTRTAEPMRDAEPIHEAQPPRISRERPRRPNA
jgi:hypothetical protein